MVRADHDRRRPAGHGLGAEGVDGERAHRRRLVGRVQRPTWLGLPPRLVRRAALFGFLPHLQHAHRHAQEGAAVRAALPALCPSHLRRLHPLRLAHLRTLPL